MNRILIWHQSYCWKRHLTLINQYTASLGTLLSQANKNQIGSLMKALRLTKLASDGLRVGLAGPATRPPVRADGTMRAISKADDLPS
jgi:hypothetical protein